MHPIPTLFWCFVVKFVFTSVRHGYVTSRSTAAPEEYVLEEHVALSKNVIITKLKPSKTKPFAYSLWYTSFAYLVNSYNYNEMRN